MEVCYNCDIAYNEKKCPLCESKKEILDLEREIEELVDKNA